MTPAIAERFLRALGATKFDKTTLPWLTSDCILAPWRHTGGVDNSPSMGMLCGHMQPRLHCFSCHFSGSPEALIGELKLQSKGAVPVREALQLLDDNAETQWIDFSSLPDADKGPNQVVPFPESFWNSFTPIPVNAWPERYLHARGLLPHDIKCYEFRWDGMEQRVCVPIRGFDHRLYGIRGRYIGPDRDTYTPRYWSYLCGGITNPQVWYGEHWVDTSRPVLVTESFFDAIAARRFYSNVIAPLSAGLTAAQVARMGDVHTFVHMFDGDVAGRNASIKLQSIANHARHIVLQLPDNEDPDSVALKYGPNALKEIIAEVLPI